MSTQPLPPLVIGSLTLPVPIIQGGMSVGVSLAGLASAVANEGGMGVIGAAGIGLVRGVKDVPYEQANAIALAAEIRAAKSTTDGPIGANILMALTDHPQLIMAGIEAGVDALFLGAGQFLMAPPEVDMELLRDSSTHVIPIVSSLRGTEVMFRFWQKRYGWVPDAVVVEGPLAGGHVGYSRDEAADRTVALEDLVPPIAAFLADHRSRAGTPVPLIAAGGVRTGADISRLMDLGAAGVQLGSRFVVTHECDASLAFKMEHLRSREDDIVVIDSPVKMPGRAIQNQFLEEVKDGAHTPQNCPWKCLRTCDRINSPYCIALALLNAQKGRMHRGFAFAGARAHENDRLLAVSELMDELIVGFLEERGLLEVEPPVTMRRELGVPLTMAR